MFKSALRPVCAGLAVLLAACGNSPATPTPAVTIVPGVTPTPSIEPTPTEAVVSLSVWLPESLAPAQADDGARILDAQLSEFSSRHLDARLDVAAKKDGGPGGLLDLLRTASPIAPAALPGVIVLSDADLAVAAREGLIQPLDELLGSDTEADIFSFARAAARIDGRRMGLPWVVDFDHLVYLSDRLESPPADWAAIISDTLVFSFAFSDAAHLSDAVLSVYEELGGTIIDVEGQPALSLDPLAALLATYRDARDAGVIAPSNLDWPDPDAAWSAFRATGAPLTIARASDYLRARDDGLSLGFARAPAIDLGAARPIGRSWNLAVVARDPRRQELARDLLLHLTRDENAADWTQARRVLPANAGALAQWEPLGGYAAFARGELSRALPPPSPAALEAVSAVFLSAIRDVVMGRTTPQAAAQSAVEAVARGETQ